MFFFCSVKVLLLIKRGKYKYFCGSKRDEFYILFDIFFVSNSNIKIRFFFGIIFCLKKKICLFFFLDII